LQAVITTLNNFVVSNADPSFAKFAFVMQALTDEVIDELEDKDEATMGIFMEQMGEVIAWIGHGNNERLPEPLRIFAEQVQSPELAKV
jgi:hypothetical protein